MMEQKPQPSIYCSRPDKLLYDQACLNIISQDVTKPVKLLYQYKECHNCDYLEWTKIVNSNTSLLVKTTDTTLFRINGHTSDSCSRSFAFQQHGIYGWNITKDGCSDIYTIKPPDNPYTPLYYWIGFFAIWLTTFVAYSYIKNTRRWTNFRRSMGLPPQQNDDLGNEDEGIVAGDSAPLVPSELVPAVLRLQQARVASIDAFRGIAITLMVFVNYGGGGYWIFKHSPWNGLTLADVVFPWFAWIMGVCIAISTRSKLRSGMSRCRIIHDVYVRSTRLLILGFLYSNFNKNDLLMYRFPGVLQRLALAFMIVAFLESLMMKSQPNFQYGRWVVLQDVLDSWIQWISIISIVGIHTLITFKMNVPDCPTGYLGPGGLDDHGKYVNCTGGAAGYIDRYVFGDNHIYSHPTSAHIYHSKVPFDPEGLLGVLTTILTVYLGVAAGRIILCTHSTGGRIKRWALYAIVTGLEAGFFCGWSKDDGLIPINKNLWSLSFVFVTASLAFLMLIILYLLIDHWKLWSGEPFSMAGMNSILIFVGHHMLKGTFPFSFSNESTSHDLFMFSNVYTVLIWISISVFLYQRSIFVKVV